MYVAMVRRWAATLYYEVWRKNLMRSGLVTVGLLGLILGSLGWAYREHMLGNFHKLKTKISTGPQEESTPQPGGQDAITLLRSRLMDGPVPEFLSVTLLPGRGTNVLQISAYIPGRGEVNLLASPSLDDAATAMTGKDADAHGEASLTMGGAFEAPWAGAIYGAGADGQVTASWRGRTIALPSTGSSGASATADGGLMLLQASDSATAATLPDGAQAQVTFSPGDFGGRWPSKTQLTVTVLLNRQAIEFGVTARNTGDTPEPIGIGWLPRFVLLDGNREEVRLRIPSERRVEMHAGQRPAGVLLPVAGTAYDFNQRGGVKLGTMGLDDCFVDLREDALDSGPVAELSDPGNDFGLRLRALSPTIHAMRVVSPVGAKYVSIGPQFNYPDPFGREWAKDSETGMVVLEPGQSTEWKVKLELYSLSNARADQ